ncbi:MAG: hypothetical protein R3326_00755 [Gemmatimonadota bacterium]|nr:hypothetical protein [Gemmatimonadota bacterium]
MRPSGTALAIVAVAALAACGEGPDAGSTADRRVIDRSGDVALPPSANAPRASLPARAPDTVRPVDDPVVDPAADTLGLDLSSVGRRSPEEFDLAAIVNTYRKYYREEYVEMGSDVRGRVDPELVEDAERRVALLWGYVEVGAWESMMADMTADQRAVLSNRLMAANEVLARELHGPGAPGPR